MNLFTSKIKFLLILLILISMVDAFDDYVFSFFVPDGGLGETIFDIGFSISELGIVLLLLMETAKCVRRMCEKDQHYQRLVEFSPQPIFLHDGEKVLYANPAFVSAVGGDKMEDFLGKSILDLTTPEFHPMLHKRMKESEKKSELPPIEYKVLRLDGQVRDFEVSTITITDHGKNIFQVIATDITERKRMELKLRESNEQLQAIFDCLDVAIFSINREHGVTFCSAGAKKLSGYAPSVFMEEDPWFWKSVIHPDDWENLKETTLEKGRARIAEYRVVHSSGRIKWVQDRLVPVFNDEGVLERTDGVIIDITDRKQAEKALRNSEQLYQLLQSSLGQFSRDVLRMNKVSELEERIIDEMEQIIHHSSVAILEAGSVLQIKRGNCHAPMETLASAMETAGELGQLIPLDEGTLIKLGERQGSSVWLWIGNRPDLHTIFPIKVWLETIVRYVHVWHENLHRIEDLTIELEQLAKASQTPPWLLRLLFNVTERERKRLSIDLHDSALQEQIIWYRKMELLCLDDSLRPETLEEMQRIRRGMKCVMDQIRTTCNQLRPPFIRKLGLMNSLQGLIREAEGRSEYRISLHASHFDAELSEEQELSIYRIVQELLNNSTKHSQATRVDIGFVHDKQKVELWYEDNGVGFQQGHDEYSQQIGLFGIKERVRSLEGELRTLSSEGEGLQVQISIPLSLNCPISNPMLMI